MRYLLKFLFFFIVLKNVSSGLEIDLEENNSSITNISGEISTKKRLPNIYLKDQTTNQQVISFTRRYDAVYFIAVPVTYYLTYNLIQQKNWYLRQTYNLDRGDELFLYFNTFFLPLIVAYFDYVYVKDYNKKNSPVQKYEQPLIPFEKNNGFFYLELYRKEF